MRMRLVSENTLKLSTKRRRALGKALRHIRETKRDGVYPGLSVDETQDVDCVFADMTKFCDVQEGAQ